MALILFSIFLNPQHCAGQTSTNAANLGSKRVLLIFSEASDLPGNVMMEQAMRGEMFARGADQIDYFTESLDANRFPGPAYQRKFQDYLKNKYTGENVDLVVAFIARDFTLADEISASVMPRLPVVFVAVGDMEIPRTVGQRPFAGIVQRFDIEGTIKFIFQLQPETRRVVVVGGVSETDQITLDRIKKVAESAPGVQFEFWTNRTISAIDSAATSLPQDTVVLISTIHRDVTGRTLNSSQAAQIVAPSASVPVYVLGAGSIGGGALGGNVVDVEALGSDAGKLALLALDGTPLDEISVDVRSNGIPMVDWRAMQRWHIPQNRLPAHCVIRYSPRSLWEEHKRLITFVGVCLFAQAITIAALLAQRKRQRRAEAEIQQQRSELAHVARISTMGQLASALTHELNQPLGAILRNAEAAEIFLQSDPPDLEEVKAILADIRKDDKRAGNVIDRARALYKRQNVVLNRVDLRDLVQDTVALTQADAETRQIKLTVQMPPHLPPVQGDRVLLQQVLLNLLLNGMDAMNDTPRPRRSLVIRTGETKNGNLQVSVSDYGIGVAPQDATRIFEPFFTTKPNGMGMGLAISRTIMQTHGGDIWVESKADGGTTFSFILPPLGLAEAKDGDVPEPAEPKTK